MRYEGIVKISGEMRVVIDETGLTLEEAKERIEREPDRSRSLFIEGVEFEDWIQPLELIEPDELEETEND